MCGRQCDKILIFASETYIINESYSTWGFFPNHPRLRKSFGRLWELGPTGAKYIFSWGCNSHAFGHIISRETHRQRINFEYFCPSRMRNFREKSYDSLMLFTAVFRLKAHPELWK